MYIKFLFNIFLNIFLIDYNDIVNMDFICLLLYLGYICIFNFEDFI